MSIWANVDAGPSLPGQTDVVVVGGGPAGYTAAIYLARAMTAPVVLAGTAAGGALMDTGIVENFPGFPDGIDGPELMTRMREQAERAGATMHTVDVDKLEYSDDPGAMHQVVTASGTVAARAVVLATGSAPRRLGLDGETELTGRGIAYCAVCEAPLFAGRDVAVVGGGDSAMEETLALAKHARHVRLLHRRDVFRAAPVLLDRVRRLSNVDVVTHSVVRALRRGSDGNLAGLTVENTDSGRSEDVAVQGLFVAIGHTPRTGLAGSLTLTPTDHIHITGPGGATELPGVFVAGDVADGRFRQAITAAGMGCAAAMETVRYLEETHV